MSRDFQLQFFSWFEPIWAPLHWLKYFWNSFRFCWDFQIFMKLHGVHDTEESVIIPLQSQTPWCAAYCRVRFICVIHTADSESDSEASHSRVRLCSMHSTAELDSTPSESKTLLVSGCSYMDNQRNHFINEHIFHEYIDLKYKSGGSLSLQFWLHSVMHIAHVRVRIF